MASAQLLRQVPYFTRPLTADKHLLKSLFDNMKPWTDGCHLIGIFEPPGLMITHALITWTHCQCLSVASAPVTVPPLPISPPFFVTFPMHSALNRSR